MTHKSGNFDEFINNKKAEKGGTYTHTRIGSKELNIYGGTYNITDEDEKNFTEKYYEKIFVKGKEEYITEKQLIENGPILIDLDFAYDKNVKKKQHTKDHVIDGVYCYCENILKLLNIPNGESIDVFVLEKSQVNQLEQKTKDGIHIIIGITMHKGLQVLLRSLVLDELKNIWSDLPIKNTWEDVFDEGVTKGFVNWQAYGSRKPGHKAYLIKNHFVLTHNSGDWGVEEHNIENFNTKASIPKLSARCTTFPKFAMKDIIKEEFQNACNTLTRNNVNKKPRVIMKQSNMNNFQMIALDKIDSMETLDKMLEATFEKDTSSNYSKLEEYHKYTMSLPTKYYGPGSYNYWIRVGWALANIDNNMFLTWLKFTSQDNCRDTLKGGNQKFDWGNVPELYEMWQGFDSNNPNGLSGRSLIYWSKIDAPDQYNKIHKETIDYFIDQTIQNITEWELAMVLYHLYKDKYVCASIKNSIWYEFSKNKWNEIDSGSALRISISRELNQLYLDRSQYITNRMQQMDSGEETHDKLRKQIAKLAEVSVVLKKTQMKNNIMREAKDIFYDKNFMEKLDQNVDLLCFNNGVVDFKNKVFRKGQPEDYLSKCTNIDYINLNPSKHSQSITEINTFIEQLFPDEELKDYMWQHLASTLVGTNSNQTFNIYTGHGSNGKSILVKLMGKCLGDYYGTVPITLVTQKRNSIGNTSSEIVQLKGVRYAVMQEPSKGDKINEGIMKEITGGDPIQGRALFKDSITFIPQFKLVVCTNSLFEIKSNDDGTWRRIRVCDFKSKFTEKPYEDDVKFPKEIYPYQFQIDKRLEHKFDKWAPILLSMLVEKAYRLQGDVKDCKMVLASSNQYREGQDYLAEFAKDKIEKKPGSKIKKTELQEAFKQWYLVNYGRTIPKVKELHEFMDKRYGAYIRGGWSNVSIIYDDDEDDLVIE